MNSKRAYSSEKVSYKYLLFKIVNVKITKYMFDNAVMKLWFSS